MDSKDSKSEDGGSLDESTAENQANAMPEGASLDPQDQAGESLDPVASSEAAPAAADTAAKPDAKPPKKPRGKGILSRLNIYFLLFLLVLVIALMVLFIGFQKSKQESTTSDLNSQTLSPDTVNQLKGNDVKIGDPKQILNIESNAVFAGKILVQGSADIAGALKVGGATTLNNLTVSGSGSIDQAQVNKLAVTGDASVQGQFTVQKTLNVTGGGSFGGPVTAPQITINNLILNGDLQFNRHIDAGGATPTHSNGTALGSGGTASNSGTDTAGTVVANTGSGPPAGCFATINFTVKFNATPHVVITPSSSDAGDLNYYVNRSTSSFSVCANNPSAGKSYSFDYIVID